MLSEDGVWDGESPWVLLIRHRYEALGLHRWNNDRVNGTCRLLHTDVYTLCAVCGALERSTVRRHLKKDSWPTELTVQFFALENDKCRVPIPDPKTAFSVAAFNMEADSCQ